MESTPSTEERFWAAISHLSVLAFGIGLVMPIIGWSEQRRKSKYASFQCLQALGYQSLGYTVWFLSLFVIVFLFVCLFSVIVAAVSENAGSSSAASGIIGFGLGFLMMGLFGIYFLFPVIAAISCALGRDFQYPILGHRLARYLGYNQPDAESEWLIEDREDRWVAAMGHFSVILQISGILASLATWIVQGGRSPFLKFQSIQTLIYQVLVNLFSIGSGAVYMLGFGVFIALTGFESAVHKSSSASGIGLFALFGSMLIAMLMMLTMPFFHILGQWAGYRVLKGDNYHYPLIGNLVERRMANKTLLAEDGGSSIKGEIS